MRRESHSILLLSKRDIAALLLVICALSLLLAFYGARQPRIRFNNGLGDDGVHYAKVAEALKKGERPQADAPFVYRIGTPAAAALISMVFRIPVPDAFFFFNLFMLYLLALLTYIFLRMYLSTGLALALSILFLLPFHAPPRWLLFYPVLVDNMWCVAMVAAIIIMSTPATLTRKGILVLSITSVMAVFTREVGLLIPLILVFSTYAFRRYFSCESLSAAIVQKSYLDSPHPVKDFSRAMIPLICSLFVFLLIRLLVTPTGEYRFLLAAYRSAQKSDLPYLVQTAFIAFGPLIILLFVNRKNINTHLKKTPPHLIFLFATLALAILGGTNTVRFLYWAAPVVLLLVGISLRDITARIRQSNYRTRIVLNGLLIILGLLQVANTHFWHGFYDDYSAWVRWGGLHLSTLDPVYIGACLAGGLVTVLVFNRLLPVDTSDHIHPEEKQLLM